MYYWDKRGEEYYLIHRETGNIVYSCKELSLAFWKIEDEVSLLKYGRPEYVKKWEEDTRLKLSKSVPDWNENIIVVTGAFQVDEINKCLSTHSYGKSFLKKIGVKI